MDFFHQNVVGNALGGKGETTILGVTDGTVIYVYTIYIFGSNFFVLL